MRKRTTPTLRNALVDLAAAAVVGTAFIPGDAPAYREGGSRVGAVGVRGGAVGVAGRGVAYRGAAYRGAAYRGGYYPHRGAVIGAAAVGAAALGAAAVGAATYGGYNNGYGYYGGYNNGCFRDVYGNLVCQQYKRGVLDRSLGFTRQASVSRLDAIGSPKARR